MPRILNGEALHAAVAADHQPRTATADDGTEHMLYWNGRLVRSCLLADWPAAAQPELQARGRADATRARLVAQAQGAVGKRADDLLAGHIKALLNLWLLERRALDDDGVVRPLEEWL